jgi:hypothetical protein
MFLEKPRNNFKYSWFAHNKNRIAMISAWNCLHFASIELVRSTPIKQRIVSAYRQYLAQIPEEQLPPDVRDAYAHIVRSLHGVRPLRGEDEVTASVRKMSNQEADECAMSIVTLFSQLCRSLLAQGRPSADILMLHSPEPNPPDMIQQEFEIPMLIARA